MSAITLVLALFAIDPAAGTSGFDFLRVFPTAREAALGGATAAGAESPLGFWYSPAHALAADGQRAHLGYVNYIAGIHLGSAGYCQPLDPTKGLGIGIVYLNSGSMKRTDPLGNELGTFSVANADVNVSFAYRLNDIFTLGAGLQGLYGSIDTFFTIGLAGNLAATAAIPISEVPGLSAGLVCRNLGYQVKAYQATRNPMPTEVGLGLGYRPNPSLAFALDVHKPFDNRVQVRFGAEGWVTEMFVVRLGYNTMGADLESGGGADILAGLSTGLGFRYRGYQLDYCFVPMVQLGMAHRLSLAITL